MNSFDGPI
jgi:hypothetical protein